MKRGELWTMAGGSGYASKPRPVVIVQDDAFAARDSIVVCLITTDNTDLPVFRVWVEPTAENGLKATSRLMVDKVTTVARNRLGQKIGRLNDDDVIRLNRSLLVFLGLAR
ncbi:MULTISPECIES: type II toxin-antitoxin system PemK/MazF family toxin [unclassified Synechococcus]|uniref:type II toxin-antitoxin system PemK/MazF family toxin n=1 Tax=unclassified Synechococcus TaxID=2626047 RepID=UPI0008FF333F|nr:MULTISPECIES: type II toxin-antitoxin system PemK/MazF family toxin [unclassified Synechococcus]APD47294.1 growth inhibitor PemK [Synechococcus sp. SynAce01]MCT0246198.1 type II toxin-antitoxin system PemK/MazF family toxin [Synechococcus sp. CS-601]MCT4365139.1 type II toxin-antitoxin system PemK/MazF family toxin [Candidatus Regnicoccus frigidus MAG-AL1]